MRTHVIKIIRLLSQFNKFIIELEEVKTEGNAFFKDKDYKQALNKWQSVLSKCNDQTLTTFKNVLDYDFHSFIRLEHLRVIIYSNSCQASIFVGNYHHALAIGIKARTRLKLIEKLIFNEIKNRKQKLLNKKKLNKKSIEKEKFNNKIQTMIDH